MNEHYQIFIQNLLQDHQHIKENFNKNELLKLYDQLLKFASNQLNDDGLAQDAVQECLISAIQYSDNFKGNSAFKSWVFAILKHKIADMVRAKQKYVLMSDLSKSDDDDFDLSDMLFLENERWQAEYLPKAFDDSWCDPELQAHNQGFWQVLEYCLEHLKGEQARAFLMKEYIGLDSDEICQALNISSQNYYVLLYRARINLQACLTRHWFDDERRK